MKTSCPLQLPIRKAAIRTAVILVCVVALDAVVVMFASRPLIWAIVIPGLIPLLTQVFVIMPLLRRPHSAP